MSERKGTKALELWCKKMTEGYPGVKIDNMTTSWRNGLAFCAIIHHFRPELIDFQKLDKDNVFYNNDLAFTVAEKYLGIPALLEPEDMVEYDVPDRLSILTYLSQFYRTFMTSQGTSPVRTVPKRPASVTSRGGVGAGGGGGIGSPTSASPPSKMAIRSGSSGGMPRREPCAKCGNPVYIAERLNVGKLLYHRTCFRCARCNSQLTLANCYETETPNQFCCETCPDEEESSSKPTATIAVTATRINNNEETSVLSRSLSDEEKSAGLKKLSSSEQDEESPRSEDLYSATFETALENIDNTSSLERSKYSQARSRFLTTHLANSPDDDASTEIPPELPKSKPPEHHDISNTLFISKDSGHESNISVTESDLMINSDSDFNSFSGKKTIEKTDKKAESPRTMNLFASTTKENDFKISDSNSLINKDKDNNKSGSPPRSFQSITNRNSEINSVTVKETEQLKTPNQVTKEDDDKVFKKSVVENVEGKDGPSSLVKTRMKLFERSPLIGEQKSIDGEEGNLKRPLLTDANTIQSPEKKIAYGAEDILKKKETPAPLSSPSSSNSTSIFQSKRTDIATNKENNKSQLSPPKSLNFLLGKQIALKEGKISPMKLINESRTSTKMEDEKDAKQIVQQKTNANQETKKLPSYLLQSRTKANVDVKNSKKLMESAPATKLGTKQIQEFPKLRSNIKKTEEKKALQPKIEVKDLNESKIWMKSSSANKSNTNQVQQFPSLRSKMNKSEEKKNVKLTTEEETYRKKPPDLDRRKSNKIILQTSFLGSSNVGNLNEKTMNTIAKARPKSDIDEIGSKLFRLAANRNRSVHSSDTALNKTDNESVDGKMGLKGGHSSSVRELSSALGAITNSNQHRKRGSWTDLVNSSRGSLSNRSMEDLYRAKSDENIAIKVNTIYSDKLEQQSHEELEKNVSVGDIKEESKTFNEQIQNQNNVSEILQAAIVEPAAGEILRDGHLKMEEEHRIDDEDAVIQELKSNVKEAIITPDVVPANAVEKSEDKETTNSTQKSSPDYPEDLNPFDDEDDDRNKENALSLHHNDANSSSISLDKVKVSLNPFDDDDDEEIADEMFEGEIAKIKADDKPTPAIRKKTLPSHRKEKESEIKNRINTNPFEDSSDDENAVKNDNRQNINVLLEESVTGDTLEHLQSVKFKGTSINPFEENDNTDGSDEDLYQKTENVVRKKIIPDLEKSIHKGDTPEYMQTVRYNRISVNPFEKDENVSEDEEEKMSLSSVPVSRKLTMIAAPKICLSPCWSDNDDENVSLSAANRCPVPKPRKSRSSSLGKEEIPPVMATATLRASPEPRPRKLNYSGNGLRSFGSNSSLSSGQSSGHHSARKKKPAPRPPILPPTEQQEKITDSPSESQTSSPSTSMSMSPRITSKNRKAKKAPPLPLFASSTPINANLINNHQQSSSLASLIELPLNQKENVIALAPNNHHDDNDHDNDDETSLKSVESGEKWNNEKLTKDIVNENRRNQQHATTNPSTIDSILQQEHYPPNKSTYGKWKRKKGPAPSRPVPERRMLKALPLSEFRRELDLIELQKQGLEKQGVRLEQIIRDRCEGPEGLDAENDGDSSKDTTTQPPIPIDVEDLILQLFEVVNEKNELSRREAELMYLQRQQRLEEEHADVEYQIRCLMMQPELNKTDSDKAKEEELIQRLVEIVERRNEIVECLEMDRLREAEEDDSISLSLNNYASRREEYVTNNTSNANDKIEKEETIGKKEKKKIKKMKKNKKKNGETLDADKDIDENETTTATMTHQSAAKEKKKKKFALF